MDEPEQLALLAELPQRATRHSQPGDVQGWAPDDKTNPVNATCPQCGEPSGCAVVEGKAAETCWCMQMPTVEINLPQISCWCARCLAHPRPRNQ